MLDEQKFHDHVARLFIKPEDQLGRALHAVVGISGEAGELIDTIKKTWIYGKPLDMGNIIEECGDVLFYVAALLNQYDLKMSDAINANYAKLAKRYPEGFSEKAAQERADKLVNIEE